MARTRTVRLRPSRAAMAAMGRALSAESVEKQLAAPVEEPVAEQVPATTRRPQINHKACSHAATPKARKACRKAQRAAEAQPAFVTARIGKGKAIHAMHTTGYNAGTTYCVINDYCLERAVPVAVDVPAVTCKSCLAKI